ncbi:MAG: hypothetical protein ACREJT_00740 [Myxococcota bacterium]
MRLAALALGLALTACALPADWKPNYGLPYSDPTTWRTCSTEVLAYGISYPAQNKRNIDLVCGPRRAELPHGLEMLGAFQFDRISAARGGRVRIVLSAQKGSEAFLDDRLADLVRNPARTATYMPWQESHEVAVRSRRETVEIHGRRWEHLIVSYAGDPANVWVEDYVTPLGDAVFLVLRARYGIDVPVGAEKMQKRQALTREILEAIEVVAPGSVAKSDARLEVSAEERGHAADRVDGGR